MLWRCTPPVRFRGPIINPRTFSDILKLIVWCCRWLKLLLTSDNCVAWRRATGRAVDLGGAKRLSGYFISLKYSKKAAVFKKLSLLIGKPSMSVGGAMPPPRLGAGPDLGVVKLSWPRVSAGSSSKTNKKRAQLRWKKLVANAPWHRMIE